jgi:hypothetical protein
MIPSFNKAKKGEKNKYREGYRMSASGKCRTISLFSGRRFAICIVIFFESARKCIGCRGK